MNIESILEQCPSDCYPANWIKKEHFDAYKSILDSTNFLPVNARFQERVYCVKNGLNARPKCYCGKSVNNFYADHYGNYCSLKCRNDDVTLNVSTYFTSKGYDYEEVKAKTSFLSDVTSTERLFVYLNQWTSIDELPKCKCGAGLNFNAHTKTYNDFCSVQCIFYNEHIRAQSKITMLEKYGVEHNSHLASSIEKQKKTLLEKYGVEHNLSINREQNRIKAKETVRLNTYDRLIERCNAHQHTSILSQKTDYVRSGYENIYEWQCKLCKQNFTHVYVSGIIPLCPDCFYINYSSSSKAEVEIVEFLKTICADEIKTSDRSIITPYELDVYVPAKKIAIEYDGLYWHSGHDKNYHLMKTDKCAELGIRLIHVFEDEWNFKKEIVKSRLSNLFGSIQTKIYARKCEVGNVDFQLATMFLTNNHVQGQDKSPIRYGLFYENELVSLMTFSKPRFIKNKNNSFELVRFCNKLNCNVVGGASKLLAHFNKLNDYESLVTYADLRWSVGKLYEVLGFQFVEKCVPNYWYLIDSCTVRHSRMKYQKHKLKGFLKTFDENKTEIENMLDNGHKIIWDCGNLKYRIIKKKQKED